METKPFIISKQQVVEAYRLVKANAGAAGVDRQSLEDFDKNRENNLYRIWNRMASGSYFPPPVLAVPIPKKVGGVRWLGIPTVGDRIAQMVVKLQVEPQVEPHFLHDSYGYRPKKSALDAVAVTRQRCWEYDWVLEFDIKGLFDHIPHDLLMKAVHKHTDCPWVILYIERWLTAPMQNGEGQLSERNCGTPQGGVVSPLLSNLFLHYVFDKWMQCHHPAIPWCRYADDGLAHCRTEQQAQQLLSVLRERFSACGLELHPQKTKVVYCKDGNRKGRYHRVSFDFLGYTFKPRTSWNKKNNCPFISFSPAVSKLALKSMRAKTRKTGVRNRTDLQLTDIARWFNPILQGWLNYYGRFRRSAMYAICRHFNMTLVAWAMKKYKHLRGRRTKTVKLFERIAERHPNLFAHWRIGMVGSFA